MYVNSQQDRRIRPKFRILYAKKDTGLKKAHHFRCWECWLISDMQLSFISHNLTLRKSHMVAGQNLFPRSISAKSDFQRKLNCWLSRPRPAPLLVFSPFCFVVYFPEMRPDKLFQFLFEVLFLISSLHFCLHHRGSSSEFLQPFYLQILISESQIYLLLQNKSIACLLQDIGVSLLAGIRLTIKNFKPNKKEKEVSLLWVFHLTSLACIWPLRIERGTKSKLSKNRLCWKEAV